MSVSRCKSAKTPEEPVDPQAPQSERGLVAKMRCNLPAENANFETLWSRAALFSPDIKLRLKVNTSLSAGLILGARGPHAGQPGGTFAPGTRCCGAAPRRGTRLGNGRAALGGRAWAPDMGCARNRGSGSDPAGGGAGASACGGRARLPAAPVPSPVPPVPQVSGPARGC